MLKGELQYMHNGSVGMLPFSFPEKWDEFSWKQITAFFRAKHKGFMNADFFKSFLSIPGKQANKIRHIQAYGVMEHFEGLLTEDVHMDEQPCIYIRPLWRKLYGFKGGFSYVTVGEFSEADRYYKEFKANPSDRMNLCRMIAVLFRPADKVKKKEELPDIRIDFKAKGLEKRATLISRLPRWELDSILHIYELNRKGLFKNYPAISEAEGSDDLNHGWGGFILDLAGPELGTANEIEDQYINNVLLFCERNEIRRKKAQPDKEGNKEVKMW